MADDEDDVSAILKELLRLGSVHQAWIPDPNDAGPPIGLLILSEPLAAVAFRRDQARDGKKAADATSLVPAATDELAREAGNSFPLRMLAVRPRAQMEFSPAEETEAVRLSHESARRGFMTAAYWDVINAWQRHTADVWPAPQLVNVAADTRRWAWGTYIAVAIATHDARALDAVSSWMRAGSKQRGRKRKAAYSYVINLRRTTIVETRALIRALKRDGRSIWPLPGHEAICRRCDDCRLSVTGRRPLPTGRDLANELVGAETGYTPAQVEKMFVRRKTLPQIR
jgi:hypothetical protein